MDIVQNAVIIVTNAIQKNALIVHQNIIHPEKNVYHVLQFVQNAMVQVKMIVLVVIQAITFQVQIVNALNAMKHAQFAQDLMIMSAHHVLLAIIWPPKRPKYYQELKGRNVLDANKDV